MFYSICWISIGSEYNLYKNPFKFIYYFQWILLCFNCTWESKSCEKRKREKKGIERRERIDINYDNTTSEEWQAREWLKKWDN